MDRCEDVYVFWESVALWSDLFGATFDALMMDGVVGWDGLGIRCGGEVCGVVWCDGGCVGAATATVTAIAITAPLIVVRFGAGLRIGCWLWCYRDACCCLSLWRWRVICRSSGPADLYSCFLSFLPKTIFLDCSLDDGRIQLRSRRF